LIDILPEVVTSGVDDVVSGGNVVVNVDDDEEEVTVVLLVDDGSPAKIGCIIKQTNTRR
jgi:hypothetical protein